jgi:GT2 family glycosyltransferase
VGEYIALLDDDDEWLEDKLEKQIEIFNRMPSVGLVCTNAFRVSSQKEKLDNLYFPVNPLFDSPDLLDLIHDNFVVTSSVVFRRTIVEDIGAMKEDKLLRGIEDYEYWLRIAAAGVGFYYSHEPLVIYREDTSLVRDSHAGSSYWRTIEGVYANIQKEFPKTFKVHRRKIGDEIFEIKLHCITSQILERKYHNALGTLIRVMFSRDIIRLINSLSRKIGMRMIRSLGRRV